MNRTTVVALAAAAVIGTTGGVTLAVNSGGDGDDDPTASRSTGASRTPSTSPSTGATDPSGSGKPAAAAELLYYADGAIHDGDQNVAVPSGVAAGEVRALQRVDGGWLVVQVDQDSSGEDFNTGTYLSADGDDWRFGEWYGSWDVTSDREGVAYGNGVTWHVASFADRTTEPLDILDGVGKERPFMDIVNSLRGIAIGENGIITGWDAGGTNRLVETEEDHWTHRDWGPKGVDVPITSPDGTRAVAAYPNADYAPENPVGDCLTGGKSSDPGSWWKECEIGAASLEPWSPEGDRLLIQGTSNDGPGTSWLRVVDPLTNKALSDFDPGGLLSGAEWGGDTTVFTLTYDETTNGAVIKRCDTTAATCEDVKRVGDNAVLGSG